MEYSSSDNRVIASRVVPTSDAKRGTELLSEYEIRHRKAYRTAPIGVFDSGVGGLTILTALQRALPQEDFVYIGDTAHCPYGTRSEAEVIDLSLRACHFLVQREVKLIVVACNTASQSALNTLRATYAEVPFVGVVPAVKPAARITRSGRIGVIATNQAARAAYLQQLIDHFAEGIEVEAVGSPELVTLAEQGEFDGPHVEEVVKYTLQPLLNKGVDVIVLGCTHFSALRPAIERLAGKRVQVIDSGAAIARRTYSILESEDILHPDSPAGGNLEVWCSGEPEAFSKVASKLLGYPVTAQQTVL
jgi:glutamate racemase